MATNTTKTPLQYEVVTMSMGEGKPTYNYPKLVNVRTLSEEALVKAAIEDGFAKGKYDEVLATFHGILRCMDRKLAEGYVCINEFFKAYLVLNGQVDENGGLTSENTIKTEFLSRKPIKQAIENYSLSNVKSTASVSILSVATVGGNIGEWQKNKQANAVGSNVMFDEKIGDIVTWTSGDLSGEVAVDATSENVLTMAWDSEWDEFTAGTEITLKFSLHGGNADAKAKVITKTVKVVVG